MKTYCGDNTPPGEPAVVTIRLNHRAPSALPHHPRHSLIGFDWGYNGTSSNELARCLLIDVLSQATCCAHEADATQLGNVLCPGEGVHPWVELYYTRFRDTVISDLPLDQAWTMTNYEVADWVLDQVAQDRSVQELMSEVDELSPV